MRSMMTVGLLTAVLMGCSGDQAEQAGQAEEAPRVAEPAQAAPAAQTPAGGVASEPDLPEGVTAAMVTLGKTIFEGPGTCFACHGATGEGTPIAPNLTDDEWLHVDGSYEQLLAVIDTGVQETKEFPGLMMPRGGSGISDEDLRAVTAYVWALSRPSG
ncbi:MAG: hypothetical protein BMS9Abin29_2029 [Gemmatimonadota bacterium]|nr:MAG: hypothetical protein BMS9Abin29_2029 [Gemmatimonadota bacterium]